MILSKTINNKIQYFLSRFPSKEWSGPAWYSIVRDDEGFPKTFSLQHFHPLDLGHGTATDWEAKDFAKILKDSYTKHPKLKKCCVGLIHSHHSMGAYFSGTDEGTLEDMAPEENFYCSLVVATKKEKYAFAFSYLDQYKKKSLYKLDKDDILVNNGVKPVAEWEEIADGIEEDAKPVYSNFVNGYGKVTTPITKVVDKSQTKLPLTSTNGNPYQPYENYGYGAPYGGFWEDETVESQYGTKVHEFPIEVESLTSAESEEVEAIGKEFEKGTINWYAFKEEMEKVGLQPWHYYNLASIPIKERGEVSGK